MLLLRSLAVLIIYLKSGFGLEAQISGTFYGGRLDREIEIPFEYTNNFILINVKFNRTLPLKFIFDTGAEHTILTKKEIAGILGIPYIRQFNIIGSDMRQSLKAYLIREISLDMGEIKFNRQSLLVLEEDYFHFEEFTGTNVHGIIGANLFRNFVVRINYRRKIITLTPPQLFSKPGNAFEAVPLNISKNKPYLTTSCQLTPNHREQQLRFLLDTGASLALLLHTNTGNSIKIPENAIKGNIGQGLGGFLEGYLGRTQTLELGSYNLKGVLTNYQEFLPDMDTSFLNGRNGIIGNQILERFEIILDYHRSLLYLRPNSRLDDEFEFDKSGIILIASGPYLNEFVVYDIIKNSPADRAGIRPGDRLLKVNFWPAWLLSMNSINNTFKSRNGRKIKLKIKRNDEKITVRFRLRELI